MLISTSLETNLILAAGLGLSVGLALWLLRGSAVGRRLRAAAGLAGLTLLSYLTLRGLGYNDEHLAVRVSLALTILLGAGALLQLFDWFFWEYLLGRRRHIAVPRLVVDVFNFIILAAVTLTLLNRLFGVTDLSAFLVTSTVLSAVVGLALQDTLGNVAAGLALQLEQSISVGDWVKVANAEGRVVQMNWRAMTLRTRDEQEVRLPNSTVAREIVLNYSRPTPVQRRHAALGLPYGHPPGEVKTLLEHATTGAAGVAADPPPQALVEAYGDFAVQYTLYYWITDHSRAPEIHDAVMTRLWYALRRAEISIPFPMQDLNVRMLADDHVNQLQLQQRQEVFAELRRVALLTRVPDADLKELARRSALHRYTAGEVLVRQGDAGQSLFVIKSGRVRVEVRSEAGQVTVVNHLGPDDFFGELSLLTGEPRSASVIAETEIEVVVVGKTGLAPVIAADTHLPEILSEALAARQRQLAETLAAGAATARPAPPPAAWLGRIRRFFSEG